MASASDTSTTGADSGVAAVGAQARQSSAGAETTSDIGQAEAYVANLKRLVEEFLQESLESIRNARSIHDRVANNAVTHDQQLQNVSLQALQNAVETANLAGKQTMRHHDIAIDRQWNIDEQASKVVLDDAALANMLEKIANKG